MGPYEVIEIAPGIEVVLCRGVVEEALIGEHFGLEGAVETLILTLSLGMIGPRVTDADPKANQPHRQWGIRIQAIVTPGRAIIHRHACGQPVATKGSRQRRLHSVGLFVGTGAEAERLTRMVIEHRQGMTTTVLKRDVALKIHLPKIVGDRMFKALPSGMFIALAGVQTPVATQNAGNGARCRYFVMPQALQAGTQFTTAPGRMRIAQTHHGLFHRFRRLARRAHRASGTITQPAFTFRRMPLQPISASSSW